MSTGIGACGMHFADVEEVPFNMHGEHNWGYTSNHSEFLGLLRTLELLEERGWHSHVDYICKWGDS